MYLMWYSPSTSDQHLQCGREVRAVVAALSVPSENPLDELRNPLAVGRIVISGHPLKEAG